MERARRSRVGLHGSCGAVDLQAEQLISRRGRAGTTISVPSQNIHRRRVVRRIAVDHEDETVAWQIGQVVLHHCQAQMLHQSRVVEPAQLAERDLVIGHVQQPGADCNEHQQKSRDNDQKPPQQELFEAAGLAA